MTDSSFSSLPCGGGFLATLATGKRIILVLDNDDEMILSVEKREVRLVAADRAGGIAAELRLTRPFNDDNYDNG